MALGWGTETTLRAPCHSTRVRAICLAVAFGVLVWAFFILSRAIISVLASIDPGAFVGYTYTYIYLAPYAVEASTGPGSGSHAAGHQLGSQRP